MNNMNQDKWNEINNKATHPKHVKAAVSVFIAKRYFEWLGFTVSDPNNVSANGPDLQISKAHNFFRVEVKSAGITRKSWRVSKVTRKNDDYIAIVFPSGMTHVEPMKEHLSKCTEIGSRFITDLAAIYV